jgi:hypothetical protein
MQQYEFAREPSLFAVAIDDEGFHIFLTPMLM